MVIITKVIEGDIIITEGMTIMIISKYKFKDFKRRKQRRWK